MTLPACAAERRAAALCHRSTAAGDRTVSELLLRRCNGTDGRTDRPTPYRYIDSAPHTIGAVAITGASATDSVTWLYLRRNYYRRIVTDNATCIHSVMFRIVLFFKSNLAHRQTLATADIRDPDMRFASLQYLHRCSTVTLALDCGLDTASLKKTTPMQ